jgi:hypothetical protein
MDEHVIVNKKKVHIAFDVKEKIKSCFTNMAAGEIFYKIYATTLFEVGLVHCTAEDTEKMITSNIKPFDELIKQCWISVYSKDKKGDKILVGQRKGVFPARNSLFLKEELKCIDDATKRLFLSLEDIREEYIELLYTEGYSGIMGKLKERYELRHRVLENISNVTTKRLQRLRKILNLPNLKKKEVTKDQLVQLIKSREQPLNIFIEELRSCIPGTVANDTLRYFEMKLGLAKGSYSIHFANIIVEAYVANDVYAHLPKEQIPKRRTLTRNEEIIKHFEDAVRIAKTVHGHHRAVIDLLHKVTAQWTPEGRGNIISRLIPQLESFQHKAANVKSLEGFDATVENYIIGKIDYFDGNNLKQIGRLAELTKPLIEIYKQAGSVKTLGQLYDAAFCAKVKEVLVSLEDIDTFNG